MTPQLSVVVPTYNRAPSVERLLQQLARQTVSDIEAIVVDDGSREDPSPRLWSLDLPFALRVERQTNGGAAAARHKGATLARAPVVLFLDDDMQIDPHLVAAHLAIHDRDPRAVVLGRIRPDDTMHLELFERFHADVLDRFATAVTSGRRTVRGTNVYTGNLSVRRDAYLRVGGFDATFPHSEDAELGVRLEKDGARFYLSDEASSVHSSDRASLEAWRARARRYGVCDARIAKKHPDVPHASPWRYFEELSLASRPWLAVGVALPKTSERLTGAVLRAATTLDHAQVEHAALRATTLAFGLEYARGLRDDSGSLGGAIAEWLEYRKLGHDVGRIGRLLLASTRLHQAIDADHATLCGYTEKYGGEVGSVSRDAVVRIGFQLLVAVRTMHFFRDAGATRAAMVISRMIRHVYGADIHWNADIAPGVQLVHGMGVCISPKARIGRDVILFQNVTLGESRGGAPVLGTGVHVGPGATLVGPIHIGPRTKIMGGCLVRDDVAADQIVSAPRPTVAARVTVPT